MSQKLSKAPLYYALAQVQFNPVPAMGQKYVGDIQDRLRKQGYTMFAQQQILQLQINAGPGQQSPPQFLPISTWLLTKADRSAGFILGDSTIIFHTTHYDTSKEFIPELLRGLRAVHEAIDGLEHLSRLGLRYLDAVLPGAGEKVEDYLVPPLHGVSGGHKRLYALQESVFETETAPLATQGKLVARVHKVNAVLGFPPDLAQQQLQVMERFDIKQPLEHAIIDTDHYVEGQMPVDFDGIEKQLTNMHDTHDTIFRATVTPHALNVWR